MVSTPFHRPTTPGRSPPAQDPDTLPSIPESQSHPPRRSSLGFLRRSKSGDLGGRNLSGSKLTRKRSASKQQLELERRQREAAVPRAAPRLPDLYDGAPPPPFTSFGPQSKQERVSMEQPSGAPRPPVPPIPAGDVDPYARTESMTHRGRYSYASSAISTINSPRKVRRRKDPTPFNVLVIGARNSGKTSFLNFLRTSLAPPKRRGPSKPDGPGPGPGPGLGSDPEQPARAPAPGSASSAFESHYLETEIDGERIGLTLWDSKGLEANVVDLQLREMSSFLESKFEETFTEEMKVVRAPGVQDTHIHCVFLMLDPMRLDANVTAARHAGPSNGANGKHAGRGAGGLDENLDLQVLRTLQGKTTVVPVISKADTITTAHMAFLKKVVWDGLKLANLDPLEALGLDDLDASSLDERSEAGSSDGSILIQQSNAEQEEDVSPTDAGAAAAATSAVPPPTGPLPQPPRR
ncbi:MAG: hypothetical protein M1832_003356, partial [Thelocarpon impressellum]